MSKRWVWSLALPVALSFAAAGCSLLVRNELDKKASATTDSGPRPDGAPGDGPRRDGATPHSEGLLPPPEGMGACSYRFLGLALRGPGRRAFQVAKGLDGALHLAWLRPDQSLVYRRLDAQHPETSGRELVVAETPPRSFAIALVAGEVAIVLIAEDKPAELQLALLRDGAFGRRALRHAMLAATEPQELAAVGSASGLFVAASGTSGAVIVQPQGPLADATELGICSLGSGAAYLYPRLALSSDGRFIAVSTFQKSTPGQGWAVFSGNTDQLCQIPSKRWSPPQAQNGSVSASPAELAVEPDPNDGSRPRTHIAFVFPDAVQLGQTPAGTLLYGLAQAGAPALEPVEFGVEPEAVALTLQPAPDGAGRPEPIVAYHQAFDERRLFWQRVAGLNEGRFDPPSGGPRGMGSGIFLFSGAASGTGPQGRAPFQLIADAPEPFGQGPQGLSYGQCEVQGANCEQARSSNGSGPQGLRDFGEACDGPDFGGLDCYWYWGLPGELICGQDCTFVDTRDCGLVAHWQFEEGQPDEVRSSWPDRRNSGLIAQCLQGSCPRSPQAAGTSGFYLPLQRDQTLEIQNPFAAQGPIEAFTVAFAFNFTPPSAGEAHSLIAVQGLGGASLRCALGGSNTHSALQCKLVDKEGKVMVERSALLPADGVAWRQLLLEYVGADPATGAELTIYLSGQVLLSLALPSSLGSFVPARIAFGNPDNGASAGFQGGLDEIVIYGRALDARELESYAADPRPPQLGGR